LGKEVINPDENGGSSKTIVLGAKLMSILKILGRRLVLYQRQYRFRWPDAITCSAPPPEGVVFTQVTHRNVELVREWKGVLHEGRFRVLLNRGHLGIYAIEDGRVVGFLWLAINLGTQSSGCWHDLIDVGEAISSRAETRPEYARKLVSFHTHAELLELVRRLYGDRVIRIWGETPKENQEMQGLANALGCIRTKEQHVLAFVSLLFIYRTWDLVPETATRTGRGRTTIRIRIPDFFYSPWFIRLWRKPAPNEEQ